MLVACKMDNRKVEKVELRIALGKGILFKLFS